MNKATLIALALSATAAIAAPALAQDRGQDRGQDRVIVRDNGWSPQIVVRSGHRGYWDERHHWRQMSVVTHAGHRGYWDHHHAWHDWNG